MVCRMKLWSCTNHKTFWPVGGASVVVAETESRARELLAVALKDHAESLAPDDVNDLELVPISLDFEQAVILLDGDY